MSDAMMGGDGHRAYLREYRATCRKNARAFSLILLGVVAFFALVLPVISGVLHGNIPSWMAGPLEMIGNAWVAFRDSADAALTTLTEPVTRRLDLWGAMLEAKALALSPFAWASVQDGPEVRHAAALPAVLSVLPLAMLVGAVLCLFRLGRPFAKFGAVLFLVVCGVALYSDFLLALVQTLGGMTGGAQAPVTPKTYVGLMGISLITCLVTMLGWDLKSVHEARMLEFHYKVEAVEVPGATLIRCLLVVVGVLAAAGGAYTGALIGHATPAMWMGAALAGAGYTYAVATLAGCGLLLLRTEPLPPKEPVPE